MPLSVIIVDDEQLARDELSYLLRDVEDIDIIGQGKNGVEAVSLIKETAPDLVFLDVQMPGLGRLWSHQETAGEEDSGAEYRLLYGV
jgi:two-component system response regulator LytT